MQPAVQVLSIYVSWHNEFILLPNITTHELIINAIGIWPEV